MKAYKDFAFFAITHTKEKPFYRLQSTVHEMHDNKDVLCHSMNEHTHTHSHKHFSLKATEVKLVATDVAQCLGKYLSFFYHQGTSVLISDFFFQHRLTS